MNIATRLVCAVLLLTATLARADTSPPPLADLAARVMPSVVSIASTDPVPPGQQPDSNGPDGGGGDSGGDGGGDDGSAFHPADDISGTVLPPPKAEEALGSGFVIDPAGYIVTNNHVINGAASVTVTFQDGTILPAIIVGRDKDADLALLKVAAGHPLPALSFGDSNKIRVGDWVLAIGNPFGLPGSTSAGIISALHRNLGAGTYDDFIQTDAPINRGNSGGPLFNLAGQVIGVNSEIYSPSGGSVGIGFAIPSAMVAPVIQSLKTTGSMTRGWLGADTEDVTPSVEQILGLPDDHGALVGAIAPHSPAAGILRPGDVLTSLDGVAIKNPRALLVRTGEIPAGESVPVQFWRDGAAQDASLRLDAPPPATNDSIATGPNTGPGTLTLAALGLALSKKPTDGGVTITAATSPAATAGIVAGDLVEQVAGADVSTASGLKDAIDQLQAAKLPVATLLISGDAADGSNPGPRWVPVAFKK
ncbi:MAG: trypsin-like peptidase domain-containing protein [Acidocella sp.]|nr:trypsin-like peptidase domain-containing protein [Acidocella sp.]